MAATLSRPSTSSIGSDYSIQLLCSVPGSLPRSAKPTVQKLTVVATILSSHLADNDLAHAFLGRHALEIRGAPVSSKWVEVDVSRPLAGGLSRVKEVLNAHPDFAVHCEAKEYGIDRFLVSHKCGIYIRMSVGAVAHLRKKTITVSVPLSSTSVPCLLPLLTPARQFLHTVLIASSGEGRPEDIEDLIWLHANLRMELLQDPSTLKKTWDEGRLQALIERFPEIANVVVDLGLAAIADGGNFEASQISSRASWAS